MLSDELRDVFRRATVVDGNRQAELNRKGEQRIEARHLHGPFDRAVLQVQAHLADRDHAFARRQRTYLLEVRLGLFGRIVSEPGPHRRKRLCHFNGAPVVLGVDADCDHPRHAGLARQRHDLGGVAELLQVEVRVYESDSTTSSRRLNSAWGSGSLRPGSSSDGRHRSSGSP